MIRTTIIKKSEKHRSKKSLFNIYIVLHYKNTAAKYATVANCSIFTKKITHK